MPPISSTFILAGFWFLGTGVPFLNNANPSPEALLSLLLASLSAFFGCMVGSVIPLLNTELLVLGLAAATPTYAILPLIVLATAGTMVGKSLLFHTGRGAVQIRIRGREKVDAFLANIEQRKGLTGSLLFVSAATGFPPFYIVAVASGAAGIALSRFLAVGFVGRFLRFTALVVAPHIVKELIL